MTHVEEWDRNITCKDINVMLLISVPCYNVLILLSEDEWPFKGWNLLKLHIVLLQWWFSNIWVQLSVFGIDMQRYFSLLKASERKTCDDGLLTKSELATQKSRIRIV
jgi:hypothetical protein